jgi:hypothetical protein
MATKQETVEQAARGEGCLGRALDDEPVFVLRARDALAVRTIQFWMQELAKIRLNSPKIEQANDDVQKFLHWGGVNGTKFPD